MIKWALRAVLAGALLLAAPACTSAHKQDLSAAYESCKSRDGDAFDRCVKAEKERLDLERSQSNKRCLAEISEQEDRAAMRRGERTGDPDSEAWTGDC